MLKKLNKLAILLTPFTVVASLLFVHETQGLVHHSLKKESPAKVYNHEVGHDTPTGEIDWVELTTESFQTEGTYSGGTLTGGSSDTETVYFYLGENIFFTDDNINFDGIYITGYATLCLNGNLLYGTDTQSVITITSSGSYVEICDCKYKDENYGHNYYVDNTNNKYVFDDDSDEWDIDYANADITGTMYGGIITGGQGTYGYGDGGGIYVSRCTLIFNSGNVAGNRAGYGGGIYITVSSSTLIMNDGTVEGNYGSSNDNIGSGAGIFVSRGVFNMNGGTITNNYTVSDGSAIYMRSTAVAHIYDGYVDGDVYSNYSTISITGGYFSTTGYESIENKTFVNTNTHIILDISKLGGTNFDEDYLEEFPYAVYLIGTPNYTIEDITVCPNIDYEDQIVINNAPDTVNVTYSYQDSNGETINKLPTEIGEYEVKASFDVAMGIVDGIKTYYDTYETTFNVYVVEHNLIHVERLEPTKTEDGHYEYWYCDRCGKYFLDEACINETTYEDLIIPAIGDFDYFIILWICLAVLLLIIIGIVIFFVVKKKQSKKLKK